MRSDDGGSRKASPSEPSRPTYRSLVRLVRTRLATRIARRTLASTAKKTSALTSHVEPNNRLKVTMLRVSSSRNAIPSTKKCGLNRVRGVPLRLAPRAIISPAQARIRMSAMMKWLGIPGSRLYRNGQSSVA